MSTDVDLTEVARKMVQDNLVIAPWLLHDIAGERRIGVNLLREVEAAAQTFASMHWRPDWWVEIAGRQSLSPQTVAEAYYEIVCGTAVYLSHLELGTLSVSEGMVKVAERLVEHFAKEYGAYELTSMYLLTTLFEDFQVVHYYGNLPVSDFVGGTFHKPWTTRSLAGELKNAVENKAMEVRNDVVALTSVGAASLRTMTTILTESGLLQHRFRLIRLHSFNMVEHLNSILNRLNPMLAEDRRHVIQLSQLTPGLRVLELGCGDGALTFSAGLYEAVGAQGWLIAGDPSVGLLARAKRKRDELGAWWVETVHLWAERIPYPDESFDRVIGFGFLHFTNIEQTMAEVRRVLKPGVVFVTSYPLDFPPHGGAFFRDWFAPLLEGTEVTQAAGVLPAPDLVPTLSASLFPGARIDNTYETIYYDNPEAVVQFVIGLGNLFERQMYQLPWHAREELMDQLIQRGEQIRERYGAEALRELHPIQTIVCTKSSL